MPISALMRFLSGRSRSGVSAGKKRTKHRRRKSHHAPEHHKKLTHKKSKHKKHKHRRRWHHPKKHHPAHAAGVSRRGTSPAKLPLPTPGTSNGTVVGTQSNESPTSPGGAATSGGQTSPTSGNQGGSTGTQGGGSAYQPANLGPSGHGLPGLLVTNEVLWSTDPRVGLDPSSTGDQSAQLQTFASILTGSASHADRVGYLVPGRYFKSTPINFASATEAHMWRLFGAGSKGGVNAASVIADMVDHGSGSYSITISGDATFEIDGIALVGAAVAPAPGSAEWKMRAIYLETYCTVRDFSASGYFAGMTLMGDHMLIEDIDVRGNAYGIDFGPNAVTQGDVIIRRGRLGNCSIAAIGVARSGVMAGARFQDIDCSNSPYAIKRYDDGSEANVPNWFNGVDMINVATDNIGNAIVCNDIDGSGIAAVTFDHGFFGNPGLYQGPVDPHGPRNGAWYSKGSISDVRFLKSLPSSTASQPGVYAPAMVRVLCDTAAGIPKACAAGERPFALWGNQNGGHLEGSAFGEAYGYGTLVVPCKTDVAITRGQCLTATDQYNLYPYSGSGRVVGIAAHDASPNDVIHVLANGTEQAVLNSSAETIAANALLIPDPNGGVAAGDYTGGGQILGRALVSIASGALGLACLRIGASR